MASQKSRAEWSVQPGRVLMRDGKPHILIATPSAFFKDAPSATQEEADALSDHIAYLLSEYGDGTE